MIPVWSQANISIDIEMISPKQLIGECLDLAALMLRELIDVYCNINQFELPFTNQKNDFTALINYILDQSRCQKILDNFIKQDPKTNKPFVKSWLYELRYVRNAWAHSPPENISYRLANRYICSYSGPSIRCHQSTQASMGIQAVSFPRKQSFIVKKCQQLLQKATIMDSDKLLQFEIYYSYNQLFILGYQLHCSISS